MRVGPRGAVRTGGAENGQHQTPHRIGRQPAVPEQFVEADIGPHQLVLPVGRDQVVQGGRVGGPRHEGAGGAGDQRVNSAASGSASARVGLVADSSCQRRQPVAVVVVADLVDQAGEAIDGQQVGSPAGRAEAARRPGSSPRRPGRRTSGRGQGRLGPSVVEAGEEDGCRRADRVVTSMYALSKAACQGPSRVGRLRSGGDQHRVQAVVRRPVGADRPLQYGGEGRLDERQAGPDGIVGGRLPGR